MLLAALAALMLGNLVDLPAIALAAVALGILQQGVLWNHESDPGLVGPVLAAVVIVVPAGPPGGLVAGRGRRRVDLGRVRRGPPRPPRAAFAH